MIKEMREVEQRLGKPDPSEDTQKKQKQIVKRIETLIEQVKQSGRRPEAWLCGECVSQGQQQGQEDGDQTGAQARGAPPMKPAKPTSQHSTAGGKDSGDTCRPSCARSWKTPSRRPSSTRRES